MSGTPMLSRLRGWFRSPPPLRMQPRDVSTPDYAAKGYGTWRPAHLPRIRPPIVARTFGAVSVDLADRLDPIVPAVGAIESTGILVAGEHGTPLASDGTVLSDHSWFRGHFDQMPRDGSPLTVRHLPGTALALATEWAGDSYGHFLMDLVPRIAVAEALGLEPASFDYVIAAAPTQDLAASYGLGGSRLVRPERGVAFKASGTVAITFPGTRRWIEPWAIAFLRHRVHRPATARRLYIPRTSRKPVNEDALLRILRPFGFETYAPELDQSRQAAMFAGADIVVGAHGSALANLAFCRPGTRVLELIPSDHVFPYYAALAASGDLDYSYIVGHSAGGRADDTIGPSPFDFAVDEDAFAAAVSVLVREAPLRP